MRDLLQTRTGGTTLLGDLEEFANDRTAWSSERRLSDLSQGIASYLAEIERGKHLPQHRFYDSRFFAEIPRRPREHVDAGLAWAPLAPVRQPRSAAPTHLIHDLVEPDHGRRIQFVWEEMRPGKPPLRAEESVRFLSRGEWLGRVDDIRKDRFGATIWDRADPALVESAEFFLDQVSRGDLPLLVEGAPFYWAVGYFENASGERTSGSRLRFQRTRDEPPPELAREARDRARRTIERFGLSPQDPGA